MAWKEAVAKGRAEAREATNWSGICRGTSRSACTILRPGNALLSKLPAPLPRSRTRDDGGNDVRISCIVSTKPGPYWTRPTQFGHLAHATIAPTLRSGGSGQAVLRDTASAHMSRTGRATRPSVGEKPGCPRNCRARTREGRCRTRSHRADPQGAPGPAAGDLVFLLS